MSVARDTKRPQNVKKKKKKKGSVFVDAEAEESECDTLSSDDEDGSGLDEFEDSFVNDATQLTQDVTAGRHGNPLFVCSIPQFD